MADIGKAYVEIIPKAPGISGKVAGLLAPESKSAGEKAGKEAGNGFGSSIKKTLAKLAIGATIGAGIKTALDEGAKLQQSFGGIDTLYGNVTESAQAAGMSVKEYMELNGNAADKVKQFATEAAKAGISANDYAEQAVSFGAGLKQAFGGDAAKAAEAANTAILDMADNAAKMGTPLESIQNAYQGFAKGNYTMLDNLKLGYGGTKEEMQRLLADAEKLTDVKYDMNNLGDVYSAIHAIQGDLGLTGVAAAEASETFSGSFEAMKASAANLAGALALGQGVGPAMQTLVTSIGTFVFGNLLPMLGTIATSLPEAISGAISAAVPVIAAKGPEMLSGLAAKGPEMLSGLAAGIQTAIPTLASKGQSIITAVIQGVTTYAPTLYAKAVEIVAGLANGFMAAFPGIMDKGRELLVNLINGIGAAIPMLSEKASEIISSIAEWLATNFPIIAQKGAEMLQSLATAIISNIPTVLAAVVRLIPVIAKALVRLVPVAISAVAKMIAGLVAGIRAGWGNIQPAIRGLIDKAANVLRGLIAKAKTIMNQVMSAMVGVWNSIKSKAGTAFEAVKKKITEPIEKAKTTVKNTLEKIKGFFPVSVGKIFSNLKLPHFSVKGGTAPWGIGGMGTKPTFSVDWYKKAKAQPYVFDTPTFFGAGDTNDEMLYGRQNLMNDIREAVGSQGGGNTYNINITVDGAENPEDYARRLARQLQMELRIA